MVDNFLYYLLRVGITKKYNYINMEYGHRSYSNIKSMDMEE